MNKPQSRSGLGMKGQILDKRKLDKRKNMRTRELTEIIGRRDAEAIGSALEENWNDWGRFERSEATATTYVERIRRIEDSLLGVIYGDQDLIFA